MKMLFAPIAMKSKSIKVGGSHSEVFFSEGNHKLECYQCGEVFRVNTETRYVYEIEELEE